MYLIYANHRCTQGGEGEKGKVNIGTLKANFKTLFSKNAIKTQKRGKPLYIFSENLNPLGNLSKTSGTPSLEFLIRVHLWC
jgi:hypothetical protein